MTGTTLTSRRAPHELFDGFADATEAEKADRRRRAIEWLKRQPMDRKMIYIVPDLDTGEDLMLSHPGIQ
jgi:hypothetical protein